MQKDMKIVLDFDTICLKGTLDNSESARELYRNLPLDIDLVQWGNELYGDTGISMPERNLVPELQAGSIAYSTRGNYLCVFYGQQPAWPVEVIGQVENGEWKKLQQTRGLTRLKVYAE